VEILRRQRLRYLLEQEMQPPRRCRWVLGLLVLVALLEAVSLVTD
jgi:hypothetical protein